LGRSEINRSIKRTNLIKLKMLQTFPSSKGMKVMLENCIMTWVLTKTGAGVVGFRVVGGIVGGGTV
jgi:RNA-binding protein YhbY